MYKPANGSDLDAMNEVGWCYLEGFGCKKDKVRFLPFRTSFVVSLSNPTLLAIFCISPPSKKRHQAPTPLPSHPLIAKRGELPPRSPPPPHNPEDPSTPDRAYTDTTDGVSKVLPARRERREQDYREWMVSPTSLPCCFCFFGP